MSKDLISSVANKNDIRADVFYAIIMNESSGVLSWRVNGQHVMPINIEGHYFYKLLKPDVRKVAVAQGLAAKASGAIAVPQTYAGRYAMVKRMAALDSTAAYQSISMGAGQIMGTWHRRVGYSTPEEMFAALMRDPEAALKAVAEFIKSNPRLYHAVNMAELETIAYIYNGPKHAKNKYVQKLKRNMDAYAVSGRENTVSVSVNADYKAAILANHDSIVEFQELNGLVPDGIIGPITRAKVDELKAAKKKPITKTGAILTTAAATGGAVAGVAAESNNMMQQFEPVIQMVSGLSAYGSYFAVVLITAIVVAALTKVIIERGK